MTRARLAAVALVGLVVPPVRAAPLDDVLRVAPPDAALVVVVRDARAHVRNVAGSPFAAWLPHSTIGRQLAAGVNPKQVQASAGVLFAALGTTGDEVLDDVLGDAVVFAYTPAPATDPSGERAVLLVRPRKPAALAGLIDRINAVQTGNDEVKAVVRRQHNGAEFFAREKPGGGADFYCFCGGVFAFSGTEPDIRDVIDRDRASPAADGKQTGLADKLTRLGVADAAAVALVSPRAFDAPLAARVAAAKPAERSLLDRFQRLWTALDSAALYGSLGADAEVGLSLRFRPGKLPPAARAWLGRPRVGPEIWGAVPDTALAAVAGRFTAAELLDAVGVLVPGDEKNPLRAAVDKSLGPVFGRDRLPDVLDALGPNWAAWATPPAAGGLLPVGVVAVQLSGTGSRGRDTTRAVTRALGFGFEAVRVAYNARHADQIELREAADGDATVTSLVNGAGFPPGFQPAFAVKGGYVVVSTSPDAIRRFRPPVGGTSQAVQPIVARLSGPACRAYLKEHRKPLAAYLAAAGPGDGDGALKVLDQLAELLEPVDQVEIGIQGDEDRLRLAVRFKLVRPLTK